MSALRTAAQQALEALEMAEFDPHSSDAVHKAITALKAALVEPPTNQCGETCERAKLCAACARALAEPVQEPVAWMHVPYPGNAISPMLSLSKHREPSIYAASVPLYFKEQL